MRSEPQLMESILIIAETRNSKLAAAVHNCVDTNELRIEFCILNSLVDTKCLKGYVFTDLIKFMCFGF